MVDIKIEADTTELDTALLELQNQANDNSAVGSDNAQSIGVLSQLCATLQQAINNLDARVLALETAPQVGIPAGIKGLWLQDANPNNYNVESVQQAAALGANAIFIFVGTGRGVSFENSAGIPRNSNDLGMIVNEAARLGMVVYPAIPTKYFWRLAYPYQDMIGKLGITEHWLDYRNADARELIATLCADLAKYHISGICLDYTRWSRYWYPGSGLTPDAITETVAMCSEILIGTGVKLCASPISIWDDPTYGALTAYGQDWHAWLDYGYADFVFPMTYYGEWLQERINEWKAAGYWPTWTAPILSPVKWQGGSTEIQKTDADFRAEFATLRANGARGCAMFDLATIQKYPSKQAILIDEWRNNG